MFSHGTSSRVCLYQPYNQCRLVLRAWHPPRSRRGYDVSISTGPTRRQLRDNAAARSIVIGGEEACSVQTALLTRMYGPAVRCKKFRQPGRCGLASMYPALIGACCAPGHHGYQRAFELISGQASNGPFGSPVFACAGKTDPPSSSHPLADLGGTSKQLLAEDLCLQCCLRSHQVDERPENQPAKISHTR